MTHRRILTSAVGPALVSAASQWIHEVGSQFGLGDGDRYRLDLCVEELVTNLVKYGGDAGEGTLVDLSVDVEEGELRLVVSDRLAPFNPLLVEPAAIPSSIAELEVGGRGIQLVREFSDESAYEFASGRNRLTLVFALTEPASVPEMPPELADAGIFRDVPGSSITDALGGLTIREIGADVLLLARGEVNDSVLLLLSGELHIHLDEPGGDEFIRVAPGECIGEMSVVDDLPVSAFVRALAGSRLLVIDAATFLNRVLAIPRVSRNLISAQAERMRRSDRITIERMRRLMALEQAQREMDYARDIQASLLPPEPMFADDARIDCVGRMRPAREVGGDFYDAFFLDERRLLFIVADVCGKGLPAALFMVRAIAALRAQSRLRAVSESHLESLMAELNDQLCERNDARQFLTAFCGVIDVETHRMQYVNAGHNPPLLAAADGAFQFAGEPVNPPVGMVPGLRYRPGEAQLGAGSRLIVYSDGVTEAENHDSAMLGDDGLVECVDGLSSRSPGALVDAVFAAVDGFAAGARQSDDITVLAIGCMGTDGALEATL